MDRADLEKLWPENKSRAIWVRNNREAIMEHTSIDEPIPEGSVFEIRDWLDSYKGVVTRQLSGETTNTDDGEGGE